MSKQKMSSFGERLKNLRAERQLPQRKIAALLDIDSSLLAKYERDERQPSKEMIVKIANLFVVDCADLINEALSDKIAHQIIKEEADSKILRIAESKVKYFKSK